MTSKTKYKPTMLQRQPHQVSIFTGICHKLPFVATKARDKTEDKTENKKWEFVRETKTEIIKMQASQTITAYDMFVLIAAVKVFQDNFCSIEPEIFDRKPMYRIEIDFHRFLTDYIDNKNKSAVIQSLERLITFFVFINTKDNSEATNQRYLYTFSVKDKKVSFVISEAFYKKCTESPWLINFDKLKKIKSPTGRALFLYFAGNNRNDFKQATLETWLDMPNNSSREVCDNRKQIKRALEELLKAEVIQGHKYDEISKKFILNRHIKSDNEIENADFCEL